MRTRKKRAYRERTLIYTTEGPLRMFSGVLPNTCIWAGKHDLKRMEYQRELTARQKKFVIQEGIHFLGLLQEIPTNLVTKSNINLFSHTSGSRKSEVNFTEPKTKVQPGSCSLQRNQVEENHPFLVLSIFSQLLAFCDQWLQCYSLCCMVTSISPLCLCQISVYLSL